LTRTAELPAEKVADPDQVRTGKPPAILLGGETISLAVGRRLSAAGVPVYGLGYWADPLRVSRHRRAYVPTSGTADVLNWLETGPRQGVVLPCYDDGLELVALHRARIEELGYRAIEADDDVLLAMLDKTRTYELAAAAGIAVPRTAAVASHEEAVAAAEEIGYPCALKPRHSHRFARHFGLLRKAIVVESRADLEAALTETSGLGLDLLVTEIIPGPDDGFVSYYSYLDSEGEPLFHVTKRKPRQFPPGFGLGSYHLTDWNPEVAAAGLRFFQGIGLRGLANVEFKRDSRDGCLKLIECNHRFTAATAQLCAAGADIALFTYNRLLGLDGPEIDGYRRGVALWYPGRDLRAFLQYRRQGQLTLRAWLRSLLRRQRFPLARADDPVPSLAAVARRLFRLFKRRPAS